MFTADEREEIDCFAFATRDIVDEFFVDHIPASCGEEYGIDIISVIRIDGVDQAAAV